MMFSPAIVRALSMRLRSLTALFATFLLSFTTLACAQTQLTPEKKYADVLKAFPELEGYIKVIVYPTINANDKLEIMGGKVLEVDCNRRFGGSDFEKRDLQGWGYQYYVYDGKNVGSASTMMACVGGQPAHQRLVNSATLLVNNNPRMPVVIYAQPDTVITYRFFTACATQIAYGQGVNSNQLPDTKLPASACE